MLTIVTQAGVKMITMKMKVLTATGIEQHNSAFFLPNLSAAAPKTKTAIGAKMNMMLAIQETCSSVAGCCEGALGPMRSSRCGEIQPMAVP